MHIAPIATWIASYLTTYIAIVIASYVYVHLMCASISILYGSEQNKVNIMMM